MRITDVKAIPVRIPRRYTFTSSLGTHACSENAVVQIQTNEGIVGVGEASTIWGRKGRGAADDIERVIGPALIGKDPFCLREVALAMSRLVDRSYPARAAIDMALFDILGKALSTPVYQLLGGKVRDYVTLSHSLSMGGGSQVAQQAQALAAEGYQTLKVKIGLDPEADQETVAAVRRAVGPNLKLRVDANMGWSSPEQAVHEIKQLAPFDLELVEQPLHYGDLDGMRWVRDRVDVPIMADESVWTPEDALRSIRAEAVDVINVYVAEAGGLLPALDIFAIAQAAGVPCLIGSMPEFGIGTAAQAHLALAVHHLPYACDVNGFVYHSDDIIQGSLDLADGKLYPPSGPGLGVSVDWEKVERYRVRT